MREILFRGFHPDINGDSKAFVNGEWVHGKWVCGSSSTTKDDCIEEEMKKIMAMCSALGIILKTVGCFTGFVDKNKKKIFDGDILYKSSNGKKAKIKWEKGYANFYPLFKCENDFDEKYVEVLGNIFENPELLEDQA